MREGGGSLTAAPSKDWPLTSRDLGKPGGKAASRAVAMACFVLLLLAAFATPGGRTGQTDFLSYYTGARLAWTPGLYSPGQVHALQSQYGDPAALRPFVRLPFYAALLWPLGRLPYFTAHLVWQCLMLLAGMHGYAVDGSLLLPLLIGLSAGIGLGRAYLLTGLVGLSAVTLASSHTAVAGQCALVALFLWVVLFAPLADESAA